MPPIFFILCKTMDNLFHRFFFMNRHGYLFIYMMRKGFLIFFCRCLLFVPFLQAWEFFYHFLFCIPMPIACFCTGNTPNFLSCLFYSLDIVHRFCIMRHTSCCINCTRSGIIRCFGIYKRFTPCTVSACYLSQVFNTAINIFPAIIRIDVQLGCCFRHELSYANRTDS